MITLLAADRPRFRPGPDRTSARPAFAGRITQSIRFGALIAVASLVTAAAIAEEPPAADAPETATEPIAEPLHVRIDSAVERNAIGPLAPICGDADFVRRVHLDLAGVIPTAEQVRDFLADDAPDKRQRLIDSLLESPDFSRHFAVQLNVLLLDRKAEKYVDQKVWETYLIEAIENRKPLDQMFRELIAPSVTGDDQSPTRKFLLTRDAEPHAMTRDVGRLMFGMDLQCAQCHDHPLISDYYQEDYYGLFAFLNRTSPFEDPASKTGLLAEKADGEASFESVFTGDGKPLMLPRIPRGASVYDEPELTGDEAYVAKPDKTTAAKPVYSRRAALAQMLADSPQFRRTLANRLWSLMTGRGLVHPTDFDYADNPPVNPELLALLADELAAQKFDLRHWVRQVMYSRTYQRECEPARPETVNLADVRSRLDQLTAIHEDRLAKANQLREAWSTARSAWETSLETNEQVAAELPKIEARLAEAREAITKAEQESQQAREALEQLVTRSKPIETVLIAARSAAEQLGEATDEPALTQSLALLTQRSTELAEAIKAAESQRDQKTELLTKATEAAQVIDAELAATKAKRLPTEKLVELEQAHLALFEKQQLADASRRLVDSQIKLCNDLLTYPTAASTEPERAAAIWQSVIDQWTLRGQVAPLKPLTPEQLAASAMRATGMLARSESAAQAALEKTPPKALEAEGLDEATQAQIRQVALQAELLQQLRGNVNQFVGQFGGLSGEEFQASVNQALFFGNSPTVNGWLVAGNDTLIGRLKDLDDTDTLADELSLAVLSRPASIEERREIADFLNPPAEPADAESAPSERTTALAEWVWAMLTSNEFRFNH
ncbi:MAG: DUF1549 domain-containing protein [Planctomycetaceae bacterium]|nr:MAG: DUF1549 domain-containing protein [Planctomycetaceae bacterium]